MRVDNDVMDKLCALTSFCASRIRQDSAEEPPGASAYTHHAKIMLRTCHALSMQCCAVMGPDTSHAVNGQHAERAPASHGEASQPGATCAQPPADAQPLNNATRLAMLLQNTALDLTALRELSHNSTLAAVDLASLLRCVQQCMNVCDRLHGDGAQLHAVCAAHAFHHHQNGCVSLAH